MCGSGQHNHAPAVPGGHQGCRTAHAAPSCTWNSAGTWSPGHGGQATDGHTTTTGMRVCVSVRQFCVDSGADNALAVTVYRQSQYEGDGRRGRLPDSYHRDRIPYGRNLSHPQFKPRLTLGGQASPAGRSRLPAGQWVTATAATPTPAGARSLPAEDYDFDRNRWRNCGRVTFERTGLTWIASGPQTLTLDTAGRRIRFAGACAADQARRTATLTLVASWRVFLDSRVGSQYDLTETRETRTVWEMECGPLRVSGPCDGVASDRSGVVAAMFARERESLTPGVQLAVLYDTGFNPVSSVPFTYHYSRHTFRKHLTSSYLANTGRFTGSDRSAVFPNIPSLRTSHIVYVRVTHPQDRSIHNCLGVGFKLVGLTWTVAGTPGVSAETRAAITTQSGRRGYYRFPPPREGEGMWRYSYAYNMGSAGTALPVACRPQWPTSPAGIWELYIPYSRYI